MMLVNCNKVMLNLGCGVRTHADWINIDWSLKLRLSNIPVLRGFVDCPSGIMIHDLRKGIPFGDTAADVVYASHVLEHLHKNHAGSFLREIHRVLKPGGTVRIVVPDLEAAVRKYLDALMAVRDGNTDQESIDRYEWATIFLLDQMVRTTPGGEMSRWIREKQNSTVVGSFEGTLQEIAKSISSGCERSGFKQRLSALLRPENPDSTGELHRWMYDVFSLQQLLQSNGFSDVKRVSHLESRIEGWMNYHLDNNNDSTPHQPDSIWMEGTKGDSAFRGIKETGL
ncbi:MAG: methyltransferase domain-containing protein [Desulfuromonadales bacterium]|nr:methyltransferase domain-containing protein [Desulfuromonadales bacterium]